MKTIMTIGATESIFWLNKNTESTEEKSIQVESKVSIIDSIIETIVEPIIYKC
ncbi:hypothetical protein [Flavobacterium paronense]|uniref:Uncharacterized protein n=1 Tax=Flavobacterium paronense TaxID=1392775 RepID=A0ABV5GEP9_9FLAO